MKIECDFECDLGCIVVARKYRGGEHEDLRRVRGGDRQDPIGPAACGPPDPGVGGEIRTGIGTWLGPAVSGIARLRLIRSPALSGM